MNNDTLVLDMPINDLLKGIGQPCLPDDDKACILTIRKAWNMRALMSPEDISKIKILMEVLSGTTLEGLHNLKKRYNEGGLTPKEQDKIAAMKAAMQ